ncbi:MAG TPA: methyltransferase domain-containing protein [Thermoanaerobaculia bacterium]|nr:methyltransferase domain-containing protein [Thermoanaerobaculia bacterium]
MPQRDWNETYASDDLPWDTGRPDPHLVELVTSGEVPAGRALEIGCGTGTNALWLASRGFEVVAVDVAPRAVERARAKAADSKGEVGFEVANVLTDPLPAGPFDFVFDRGCLHLFDEAAERARFAARVAEALSPKGLWASLVGSTEGPARDYGPPRRSAREIATAIEPSLEILELKAVQFDAKLPGPAAAWLCLSRRRAVPAQPSTRRD